MSLRPKSSPDAGSKSSNWPASTPPYRCRWRESVRAYAAVAADEETKFEKPAVHPHRKLRILGALAPTGIEGAPIELPCAALAPVVLKETAEDVALRLHRLRDQRRKRLCDGGEDFAETVFDLSPKLGLARLVVVLRGRGVEPGEQLERGRGEGGGNIGIGRREWHGLQAISQHLHTLRRVEHGAGKIFVGKFVHRRRDPIAEELAVDSPAFRAARRGVRRKRLEAEVATFTREMVRRAAALRTRPGRSGAGQPGRRATPSARKPRRRSCPQTPTPARFRRLSQLLMPVLPGSRKRGFGSSGPVKPR